MSYGRSIWCFFVTGMVCMSLCHGSGEKKECCSEPCDKKGGGCVGCEGD